MSYIKIVCRKNKKQDKNQKDFDTVKTINAVGDEFMIEARQLFLDTKKFFDGVKESLGKYFDTIERKK